MQRNMGEKGVVDSVELVIRWVFPHAESHILIRNLVSTNFWQVDNIPRYKRHAQTTTHPIPKLRYPLCRVVKPLAKSRLLQVTLGSFSSSSHISTD